MPKPRRRRRFFALEGRFEVGDTGELQGSVESVPGTPAQPAAPDAGFEQGPEDLPGEPGADETLPPAFQLNRTSRARSGSKSSLSAASLLLAFACLLTGLLVGFLWPRAVPKPAAAEPSGNVAKAPETLTTADQDDLDAAYIARHARNFPEAGRLFGELDRRHPEWGPVRVESGRTFFYAGQPREATVLLKQAVEKGWKPAEAQFLLAVLDKGKQSYADAEVKFAKAVALDPTIADYYFFWGECLRAEGKLLDATAKYRSAALRNQYETANGLYRAKLWLCSIEADQPGGEVNTEVDAELSGPHPTMEAFVAAAARDLKAGDLHAAQAHLSAASQRSDPIVFRYILGDPLFAEARTKPELAGFFPPPPLPAASPADSPTPGPAQR